jgi:hypothetical protein
MLNFFLIDDDDDDDDDNNNNNYYYYYLTENDKLLVNLSLHYTEMRRIFISAHRL